MERLLRICLAGAFLLLAKGAVPPALAQDAAGDLPPFKMIRSLQYVQDSVALGDHSAMEMQMFLLGQIDETLRKADGAVFDDPRNVDAALVYAMSGGNPKTLDFLAENDIAGRFDNRLTSALRDVLNGRGEASAKVLVEMMKEYTTGRIGSYLALVSANAVMRKEPEQALKYFDWARLMAPGTIIEEAALRRSIFVASKNGSVDKGLFYSRKYARRFLHSPYASQFADLFVDLSVNHFGKIREEDIVELLSFMDRERQREVYLRISRLAVIHGKGRLAQMAALRADSLSTGEESVPKTLAELYSSLADVPTGNVLSAMDAINAIPQDQLSLRDQALQNAARRMAEAVLSKPRPEDFEPPAAVGGMDSAMEAGTEPSANPSAPMPMADDASMNPVAEGGASELARPAGEVKSGETGKGDADPKFDSFMATGRSKLDEIDALLTENGG